MQEQKLLKVDKSKLEDEASAFTYKMDMQDTIRQSVRNNGRYLAEINTKLEQTIRQASAVTEECELSATFALYI